MDKDTVCNDLATLYLCPVLWSVAASLEHSQTENVWSGQGALLSTGLRQQKVRVLDLFLSASATGNRITLLQPCNAIGTCAGRQPANNPTDGDVR